MSKTVKRLSRGLDSLVGDFQPPKGTVPLREARVVSAEASGELRTLGQDSDTAGEPTAIAVDRLSPNPFQPRGTFSDASLAALAASLRQSGMIQPISARRSGGKLQIVAGERRWRAAKLAGMASVPVIVTEVDDRQMLEMALIENIQREDLNAIDRARAYRRYCDEFGVAAEELAGRLQEDRTTVTNYLRLLDLPEDVKALVAANRLSMGHARCIVGVADDPTRLRLAKAVVAHDLSVRALEEIVRREKRGAERSPDGAGRRSDKTPHLRDLEERLAVSTGTKVTIKEGRRKGSGRIVIEYYSLDDFDRISARLGLEKD